MAYPARRTFACGAGKLMAGPSTNGSRFALWEAGCTDRPVLHANLRGHFGRVVAAIVEGDCDIERAVGQRGHLCRLLPRQRHEVPASFSDPGFQLGDALGDASAQGRSDVAGFELDELTREAALEVSDLVLDLLGACLSWCVTDDVAPFTVRAT